MGRKLSGYNLKINCKMWKTYFIEKHISYFHPSPCLVDFVVVYYFGCAYKIFRQKSFWIPLWSCVKATSIKFIFLLTSSSNIDAWSRPRPQQPWKRWQAKWRQRQRRQRERRQRKWRHRHTHHWPIPETLDLLSYIIMYQHNVCIIFRDS